MTQGFCRECGADIVSIEKRPDGNAQCRNGHDRPAKTLICQKPPHFCPICGAPEFSRERRPNGNSHCDNGHPFASTAALDEPTKTYTALNHVPDSLRKYARQFGACWVVGMEPVAPTDPRLSTAEAPTGQGFQTLTFSAPVQQGPIVVAVASHMIAEIVGAVFRGLGNDQHQGVVVIPFAASATAYAAGGTALFSALVAIPPRDGPVSRVHFDSWVAQAIVPYLNPLAPRIEL
jgi:hypothetical protein